MITARVVCSNKTENGEGEHRTAHASFLPDYADGRNKEWANATPSLSLSMTLNAHAADLFRQGQAYELRFVEIHADPDPDTDPGAVAEAGGGVEG